MKAVRLVSLVARVALMVTMVLGLVFWIAQLFAWIGLLVFLAQIGFPGIHSAISRTARNKSSSVDDSLMVVPKRTPQPSL